MKHVIKWSIVVALSTTLVGASAPESVTSNSPTSEPNLVASSFVNTSDPLAYDLLTYLPENQRIAKLETLAKATVASTERSRAKYLLATIQLEKRNPRAAIATLNNLEAEYPALADYVLWKRSQALAASADLNGAKAAWNQILSQYPKSPVAAEALYALGQNQQLLQQFPSHPRSLVAVKNLLTQNPNRADLLSHMAVYFNDQKDIVPILNRLVSNYSGSLTPKQWEAIGRGYWDNAEYGKAGVAYGRAPRNAFNLYRLGRSLHRSRSLNAAHAAYNAVVQQYPNSPQAPRATIRLMEIADPAVAIKVADIIVANYPDTAAEALLKKADLLQSRLNSPKAASEARNLLLNRYGNSEPAAELTLRLAKQQAQGGNLKAAVNLAQNVITNNPNGEAAAEVSYLGGKWATRMGDRVTAKRAFEYVVAKHPTSYFAWRSATQLGWPVGDFTSIRSINLQLQPPSARKPLLAGSEGLQELYILGQDRDASDRWQFETRGKQLTSVKDIFTDGVIRVGVNDNLRGIGQIESLSWIDVDAAEKAEIQVLRQQPAFWQALYPLPYWTAVSNWSARFNLNPALVSGLIRQESRFESQILSRSGAIGLMQVMPDTGSWIASKTGISNYSLLNPDHNVQFGTWYLDYTHREYRNNSMLAIASYNAGPGRVGEWVRSFGVADNEEFADRIPYDETRGYVKQVLANYWNYLRLYSPQLKQQVAQLGQQNTQLSTK